MNRPSGDLPRSMLQVLALGFLILASAWILRPFVTPLAWAATIVVATWPLLLGAERLLGGRRAAAVATMTLGLVLLLVAPLSWAIVTLVGNSEQMVQWSHQLAEAGIPAPPAWLESMPVVGHAGLQRWREFAAQSPEQIAERLSPYAQDLGLWLVQQVGSVGLLLFEFLMTVVICALLYANGETAAAGVTRFAGRLAGTPGVDAVNLAALAVRSVAQGVIVTAVLQTSLVALGLVVAAVPFASFVTAVVFVLCVAQVGPLLVLLPTTGWVWATHGAIWGVPFLVWSVGCGVMDNFVRPILIRRGADLPLPLIFAGVVGGLFAIGVIGLFLGPVVLAVAYTLLKDWAAEYEGTGTTTPDA